MDLDDRVTLASAEGIDIDLHLAGVGSRGIAYLIDLSVQFVAMAAVLSLGSTFCDIGLAFAAVGTFLVLLGYPIIAEGFAGGRTLGKALIRIRVVSTEGTPITFLQAVIRNLVRVVDALPGVYLVGIVAALLNRRGQRVGDMAAKTLVVHRERPAVVGPPVAGSAPDQAAGASLPDDVGTWDLSAVTADELAAVRSFLGRRHELSAEHRANLAQTLSFQLLPKVAGVPLDGGPEVFLERVVAAKSVR
ncbi:hypothetical protein BH20ACT3_BH20ACT3_04950 [soil metagenome]